MIEIAQWPSQPPGSRSINLLYALLKLIDLLAREDVIRTC